MFIAGNMKCEKDNCVNFDSRSLSLATLESFDKKAYNQVVALRGNKNLPERVYFNKGL